MNTFSSIKELLRVLNRESELLSEMFEKRKSLSFTYDLAITTVDFTAERLETLLSYGIVRQNGSYLDIDDQYLQFFEQVLEVNDEINTSYINENIQNVKQNMLYYLQENNENRKYTYLKAVKNVFRKIGITILRNVVDLKRNIDNTFKNEPNYKIKKAKLENLDNKRVAIHALIEQTENLISGDEQSFFKSAYDEELGTIITQLKLNLHECRHNLIETQKQIIEYLNQIKYQTGVIQKLRQIKYLKDQFRLKQETNVEQLLTGMRDVVFETRPGYSLKVSLENLVTSDESRNIIKNQFNKLRSGTKIKKVVAENISDEYLETQEQEEIQINIDEVKNGFMASGNNLFDFVMGYNFAKEMPFDARVTLFCQMVSQYESLFNITDTISEKEETEYAMVYPG